MAKIVRYNGGTESYYGCSDPANLVFGKDYEVVHERDRGFQTDYILRGVSGAFNSCWFDEVSQTFIAIANTIPTIGKRYSCSRLEVVNGQPKFNDCLTSTVKKVVDVGNNLYTVTTHNNIYLVHVK